MTLSDTKIQQDLEVIFDAWLRKWIDPQHMGKNLWHNMCISKRESIRQYVINRLNKKQDILDPYLIRDITSIILQY